MSARVTTLQDPLVNYIAGNYTGLDVIDVSDAGHGSFVREEVLSDLAGFTQYGVRGRNVLLRTETARALLSPHPEHPVELLVITYVKHGERRKVTQFWMNRSSLTELVDALRHAPDKAHSFDVVLEGPVS